MSFKGKACLITGGARGIGKAIAQELLRQGAKCLIGDILIHAGEETCQELGQEFGQENVGFLRLDVSSHTNFELAIEKCVERFGKIDVLINNAGIISEIGWEAQLQINLLGTIRGCKLGIKYMKMGGMILNISSNQGLLSWPAMPVYTAGKTAINAFTRSMGHPVAFQEHGIKICSLCPYAVDTPFQHYVKHCGMSQAGTQFLIDHDNSADSRVLTAEDVGQAVLKVLSEGTSGSVWYLHKHGDAPYEIPDNNTYENLMQHRPEQSN